jgi:hypothetical protein
MYLKYLIYLQTIPERTDMLNPLDTTGRGAPSWLRRILAETLLAPMLTEQLVYWRAEHLYWEGVTHPDGGDHDEQAEIHAAEGAETAIRQLADHCGVQTLPSEKLTYISGLARLSASLEADERAALKVLDRLGPSQRIPLGERPHDYMQASDAEATLDRVDQIYEYLEWLKATRSDAGGYGGYEGHDAGLFKEADDEEAKS